MEYAEAWVAFKQMEELDGILMAQRRRGNPDWLEVEGLTKDQLWKFAQIKPELLSVIIQGLRAWEMIIGYFSVGKSQAENEKALIEVVSDLYVASQGKVGKQISGEMETSKLAMQMAADFRKTKWFIGVSSFLDGDKLAGLMERYLGSRLEMLKTVIGI